ncbi:hypothetical protein HPB51_004926 [Rhipicephalus microplus]|uniref:Homeobox domain-containing protein n=1 Tax=Rhipicephalus microplus TaxID=6941 RepID=A0A9J6EFF3_RHIMP|nr:hypothetical protein HPB51_004926 [Rhipicephalus microplus]
MFAGPIQQSGHKSRPGWQSPSSNYAARVRQPSEPNDSDNGEPRKRLRRKSSPTGQWREGSPGPTPLSSALALAATIWRHVSASLVKVWFQNRRTKHKRQKQEEEHSTSHGGSDCKASSSPRPPAALSPDIQMDDSSSDSTQPDPLS